MEAGCFPTSKLVETVSCVDYELHNHPSELKGVSYKTYVAYTGDSLSHISLRAHKSLTLIASGYSRCHMGRKTVSCALHQNQRPGIVRVMRNLVLCCPAWKFDFVLAVLVLIVWLVCGCFC